MLSGKPPFFDTDIIKFIPMPELEGEGVGAHTLVKLLKEKIKLIIEMRFKTDPDSK